MMDGWYGAGWMTGGWLWMTLATVAFVLLVTWAARSLGSGSVDSSRRSVPERPQQPSALETLDIRFAKGEINEDEYKSMRRTLSGA